MSLSDETRSAIHAWMGQLVDGLPAGGHQVVVEQLAPPESLIATMRADRLLGRLDSQMILTPLVAYRLGVEGMLRSLAHEVLRRPGADLDANVDGVLVELEEFLAADETESTFVSPIVGLFLGSSEVEFEPNFVLTRIPDGLPSVAQDLFVGQPLAFVTICRHERWADEGGQRSAPLFEVQQDLIARTDLALKALALVLQSTQVGLPREEYLTAMGNTWLERPTGRVYSNGGRASSFIVPLILSAQDEVEWVDVYRSLRKLSLASLGFLDRSLRRFRSARAGVNPEDRIIDATIALEALLLVGMQDELTNRLALRMAVWLGDTIEERDAIYKNAQAIYRARGKLVHGEQLDDKKMSPNELAELAVGYARQALLKAVEWAVADKVTDPKQGLLDWDRAFRNSLNV